MSLGEQRRGLIVALVTGTGRPLGGVETEHRIPLGNYVIVHIGLGIVLAASSGAPASAASAPKPSPRGTGSTWTTLRDLVGLD